MGASAALGKLCKCRPDRLFIVLITIVAYGVALRAPRQFLSLLFNMLFRDSLPSRHCWWRHYSGKEAQSGAPWRYSLDVFAVVLSPFISMPYLRLLQDRRRSWSMSGLDVLSRTPGGNRGFGFMPVGADGDYLGRC